jgi:hypothetical protein
MGHIDLLTVLLLIAGLRFKWKYIKEIIIGIYSFYLAWIIFVAISFAINNPNFLKPGYYLISIDLVLIIIFTLILNGLKK